jgi:hypothetical protein
MFKSMMRDQRGQGGVIFTLISIPIIIVILLATFTILDPIIAQLFPVLDNGAAAGTFLYVSMIKLIISMLPVIIVLLVIWNIAQSFGRREPEQF